jgi:hypothetical protein
MKFLLSLLLTCSIFANEPLLDQVRSGLKSLHLTPQNPELAAELLAMREADQSIRTQVKDYKNISQQKRQAIGHLDQKHNPRLKEILSTHGWPGIRLIGIQASHALWLLVQHQDQDLVFQKECLALLKGAVERQDAAYREYAYLLDRVRKNEHLPQVYGTQWKQNGDKWALYLCENMETLNQRRQAAGLNTIEEYKDQMKAAYRLTDADFE